jgi:hypothetical protein
MASPSLVDRAHELSHKLAAVANLAPHEDPLRRDDGKPDAATFLFEIVVLIELLQVLVKAGSVSCVRRNGSIALARAPASKQNKSYFVCTIDNAQFDLLPGIDIDDRIGTTQAPDFALHDHVPDSQTPTYQCVRAIWDAKLRGTTGAIDGDPIGKSEFAVFLLMMDLLSVPRPGAPADVLSFWNNAFEVSSLISNGRAPHQATDLLLEKGMSVTEQFTDLTSKCVPSRNDHLGLP